jgi:hypothetical protein
MKTLNYLVLLIALPALLLTSCKKDKDEDPVPTPPVAKETNLIINLNYNVDGTAVIFDTIKFQNEAGNQYSLNKLQYYLSGFKFIKQEGGELALDDIFYVDARITVNNVLIFKNFPVGNYNRIEFYIGLDSVNNISNALPNTLENINMAWPEPMGGGYHFMKMEGHFLSGGSTFGYAMHIGLNPYLVSTSTDKNFIVIKDENNNINLSMNLSEWYKNPHIYDFNVDGNYSMGNMQAMMKLAANGHDVFNEN